MHDISTPILQRLQDSCRTFYHKRTSYCLIYLAYKQQENIIVHNVELLKMSSWETAIQDNFYKPNQEKY